MNDKWVNYKLQTNNLRLYVGDLGGWIGGKYINNK